VLYAAWRRASAVTLSDDDHVLYEFGALKRSFVSSVFRKCVGGDRVRSSNAFSFVACTSTPVCVSTFPLNRRRVEFGEVILQVFQSRAENVSMLCFHQEVRIEYSPCLGSNCWFERVFLVRKRSCLSSRMVDEFCVFGTCRLRRPPHRRSIGCEFRC